MDIAKFGTIRSVLPRWRRFIDVPSHELGSSAHRETNLTCTNDLNVSYHLKKFEEEPSLITASEVMDCAAFIPADKRIKAAADFVVNQKQRASTGIAGSARLISDNLTFGSKNLVVAETLTKDFAFQQIARLKRWIIDHPRDLLAHIEVARFYTFLEQNEQCETHLDIALKLAPDNRYLLRCQASYFGMHGEFSEALKPIWRSASLKADPWVQAAEIALSTNATQGSRSANYLLRTAASRPASNYGASEVLAGLASLEYVSGSKLRRVKKILDHSLAIPTENALAQALWLGDRAGFEVQTTDLLRRTPKAYEALFTENLESRRYQSAVNASIEWQCDQQLTAHPTVSGALVAASLQGDHRRAIQMLRRAIEKFPDDFTLVNNLFVSQVFNGSFEESRETFRRLTETTPEAHQKVFWIATQGLSAFSMGDFTTGRRRYQSALEIARKEGRLGVTIRASIYWIENEVRASQLNEKDIEDFGALIGKAINSSKRHEKKELSRLWEAKESLFKKLLKTNEPGLFVHDSNLPLQVFEESFAVDHY